MLNIFKCMCTENINTRRVCVCVYTHIFIYAFFFFGLEYFVSILSRRLNYCNLTTWKKTLCFVGKSITVHIVKSWVLKFRFIMQFSAWFSKSTIMNQLQKYSPNKKVLFFYIFFFIFKMKKLSRKNRLLNKTWKIRLFFSYSLSLLLVCRAFFQISKSLKSNFRNIFSLKFYVFIGKIRRRKFEKVIYHFF